MLWDCAGHGKIAEVAPNRLAWLGLGAVLTHSMVDRTARRGGFATWHASNYTWVNNDTRSPTPIFNGFRPEVDGCAFSNTKANPYAPNGRCWGISTFTKWYKRTHGGLDVQDGDPHAHQP